jgi:hypothetical protein
VDDPFTGFARLLTPSYTLSGHVFGFGARASCPQLAISIYTRVITLKTICYVKAWRIMAGFFIAVPPKFGLEPVIISMKYRNYLFNLMIF